MLGGGGGVILGEVKARPKDIISFSLDYISKSKVQTSNPSSSPIPLDTPARPADLQYDMFVSIDFPAFFKESKNLQPVHWRNVKLSFQTPKVNVFVEDLMSQLPRNPLGLKIGDAVATWQK